MPEEFTSWVDFGIHPPHKDRRDSVELPPDLDRPPLADGDGYDVDVLNAILDN